MTEGDSDAAVGRRGFLGAVAGLAAAAAAVTASAPQARAQAENAEEKRRARYRVTPHVEAFYRTARYE
ncbi:MAG: formate dehydrogenase [Rhodobacterales bacterium CG18_big_fil_WC_8_21_14_2_50_71_9]|nr:MAG: formate dehydrogenase [Rhodobacterales bacterium CG18_big_fil_WC_8_21_14_2_50_71_9]